MPGGNLPSSPCERVWKIGIDISFILFVAVRKGISSQETAFPLKLKKLFWAIPFCSHITPNCDALTQLGLVDSTVQDKEYEQHIHLFNSTFTETKIVQIDLFVWEVFSDVVNTDYRFTKVVITCCSHKHEFFESRR